MDGGPAGAVLRPGSEAGAAVTGEAGGRREATEAKNGERPQVKMIPREGSWPGLASKPTFRFPGWGRINILGNVDLIRPTKDSTYSLFIILKSTMIQSE